jgi:glycogen operon protein
MISGGDEVGRTQRGNNNAYCIDGPDTWTPWPGDRDFLAFARQALAARGRHRAARMTRFLTTDDVTWLTLDGRRLTEADWHDATRRAFGGWFRRAGTLLYLNAGASDEPATLPGGVAWELVLDTAAPGVTGPRAGTITAGTCSLVLLAAASA